MRLILLDISEGYAAETVESERLARRYFALFGQHAFEKLREVVHPDVVLELKAVQPGHVVRGRDEFIRFLEQEFDRHLWEAVAHVFTPLDENRVIVEGRVRWFDDQNVLRDDSRIWALEFSDGLLLLSAPASNMAEAEMILLLRNVDPRAEYADEWQTRMSPRREDACDLPRLTEWIARARAD